MWTPTTREQHSRKALRYQTDLTDAEWVVMEPHLPPAGLVRANWLEGRVPGRGVGVVGASVSCG